MKKNLQLSSNLPLLHSLRGIAAFYVVVFHSKFILWSGGREYIAHYPRSLWGIGDYLLFGFDLLFSAGSEMVIIFFVLSGFFIAMILESLKGSIVQKLKTFYSVRIVRIYVPYIASILIGILVLYWIKQFAPGLYQVSSDREFNTRLIVASKDVTFSNFAKGLIFDQNKEYIGFNYAYWSLAYEAIFYLLVPFTSRFRNIYLLSSAVLFIAGSSINANFHIENVFFKFFFEFNFYFAMGQAIYIYREQLSKIIRRKYYALASVILSAILFLAFNVLSLMHLHSAAFFLASITGGLLMLLLLNYDIKKNLVVNGIKKLGEMSYSLYLFHLPTFIFIYAVLFKYTDTIIYYNHIYYFIGVLAALLVGWIFYKLVEKPSLVWIKNLKLALGQRSTQLMRAGERRHTPLKRRSISVET